MTSPRIPLPTPTDTTVDRPTVALVGTGAIGTVVADALTTSADVTMVRRSTDRAMFIDRGTGPERVDTRVTMSIDELMPVDWIVLATKAQQVQAAAAWLTALTGPTTRIAVLQNGIDHAERVSQWVTAERVVPAIVFISAERSGPDLVTLRQLDRLVLPDDSPARDFAALLSDGFPVSLEADFEAHAWRKLILNAALNSVTALTGHPVGVASRPGGRELVSTVLEEGIQVARARGVRLSRGELALMREKIANLPPNAATSMQLDRANGRPLEYQYLTGAVLREAAGTGVPTPATAALHRLMTAL